MRFDEFDQYSENLLLGQYLISEIISHELMKGEVREDFLIMTLEACSEPKPLLVKGTVSDGQDDAGQLDIILCRHGAHLRRLGSQAFVHKPDALCVIDVKGNCTARDLSKANDKAARIQALDAAPGPLCGIVAYRVQLTEKTVMNRFGFDYDASSRTYYDSATVQGSNEVDWRSIEYPDLDFFVSFEEDKNIFLRRYEVVPGKYRFIRVVSVPLIKEVFKLVRSLWQTSTDRGWDRQQ